MNAGISISGSQVPLTSALSRLALLGDLQNFSEPNPASRVNGIYPRTIEQAQVAWILANRTPRNIEAVIQVGDTVNGAWMTDSYGVLYQDFSSLIQQAGIAKMFVPGNHDTDSARDSTNFNAIGSVAGYGWGDLIPHMTGRYQAGKLENSYVETFLCGRTALVIGLEFGPRDAVVEWARQVILAHPGWFTIIVTHAFMYRDGTIYNGTQQWDPIGYGYTPGEGINTGTDLVTKLIEPFPQVKLVASGHAFQGHSYRVYTRADGSLCTCVQIDYQNNDDGTIDTTSRMGELTIDWWNRQFRWRTISAFTGLDWPVTIDSEQSTAHQTCIHDPGLGLFVPAT